MGLLQLAGFQNSIKLMSDKVIYQEQFGFKRLTHIVSNSKVGLVLNFLAHECKMGLEVVKH